MPKYLLAPGLLVALLAPVRAAPPAWEARFGVPAADFEKLNREIAEKGYRPVRLCPTSAGKEVRVTAIWEKRTDGPELDARHGLTTKELEKAVAELKDRGFRPVDVCGYEANGEVRFATVWEKAPKDAPAREMRHDLTDDGFRKLYAELTRNGFRPLHIAGYAVGKEARYTTVWERASKNGPVWYLRRDLTGNQYQDEFDAQREMKRRPIHVCGYTIGGEERFAAVWEPAATSGWYAQHGLDDKEFEKAAALLKSQGFRPMHVSGYMGGGRMRFAGTWVKE